MIIETPYKAGDIVSFKLSSAEEIVARLDEETNDTYILHKPMTLVASQQGLGLAPFMFSVSPDAKFRLSAKSVTCVAKTTKDIASQYTEQTTGIHLAN